MTHLGTGYGSYDKETKTWRGECEGERYPYVLLDASALCFTLGGNVWMFANSMEEAMKTAADMIENSSIEQVEIGVPSGDYIQIDARYVDLSGGPCNLDPSDPCGTCDGCTG
jgi:hypothetical protein